MKKVFALLLCVALALSLVACGAEKKSNPDDSTDTVVTTTAEGIGTTTTADETVTATTDKEVDTITTTKKKADTAATTKELCIVL